MPHVRRSPICNFNQPGTLSRLLFRESIIGNLYRSFSPLTVVRPPRKPGLIPSSSSQTPIPSNSLPAPHLPHMHQPHTSQLPKYQPVFLSGDITHQKAKTSELRARCWPARIPIRAKCLKWIGRLWWKNYRWAGESLTGLDWAEKGCAGRVCCVSVGMAQLRRAVFPEVEMSDRMGWKKVRDELIDKLVDRAG